MFETLFTDPRTIGRHQSGPMSGERLRYLEHLKAQGTRRGTLRITARVLYRATLHMGLRESGPIQLKAIAKASEQWAFRNAPPERWRGPGGAGSTKTLLSHHIAMAAFFGTAGGASTEAISS